jgi:hypothetical protein
MENVHTSPSEGHHEPQAGQVSDRGHRCGDDARQRDTLPNRRMLFAFVAHGFNLLWVEVSAATMTAA